MESQVDSLAFNKSFSSTVNLHHRPNDTDIQLLKRTKEILKTLEAETGSDPGFINNGGIFIARTPVRITHNSIFSEKKIKYF